MEQERVPRVTVLITLYNKGRYVEEAVRSVLANTFSDLEVLVVDDASTDDGVQKVRGIGDTRIRILESARNTGRAAAANRGFDQARGQYVAVLDADDVAHHERLARQVEFMDAHADVGVCGSAYQVLGDARVVKRWPANDADCRAKMLFGDPVVYGTAMFRRSVVEEHHLRCDVDWRYPGMDYLFVLGFSPYTRYANLQEALISYRMGENNMRHGRDVFEDRSRVVREVFRFFRIPLTDGKLELQMAFQGLFRAPFDAVNVRKLREWMDELQRVNIERGLFPPDGFKAQLQHRWQRLFHTLADHDVRAALTHLRLSQRWPLARLAYLMKVTLVRWSRRAPVQHQHPAA